MMRILHRQDAKITKSNRWEIETQGNQIGFHGDRFGLPWRTWRFGGSDSSHSRAAGLLRLSGFDSWLPTWMEIIWFLKNPEDPVAGNASEF
jgi:hypothetical protein